MDNLERCRAERSLLSSTFLSSFHLGLRHLTPLCALVKGSSSRQNLLLPKMYSFELQCKLDFSPYLPHWLSILEQAVTQTSVPKSLLLSAAFPILPSFFPHPSWFLLCMSLRSGLSFLAIQPPLPCVIRDHLSSHCHFREPLIPSSSSRSPHFRGCQSTPLFTESTSTSSLAEGL